MKKTITSDTPESDFVDTIIRRERIAYQRGQTIGLFVGWLIGAFSAYIAVTWR